MNISDGRVLRTLIKRFIVAKVALVFLLCLVSVTSTNAQVTRELSAAKKARLAADVDGNRPGPRPVRVNRGFSALAPSANPVIYAYDYGNDAIISFNADTPGTVLSNVPLVGLNLDINEILEFIDFRPSNGVLYGVVTTDPPTDNTARVVTINPTTGQVTNVGGTIPVIPGLFRGGDFNPVVDLIREVTDNVSKGNRRLNPATGAIAGTDTALSYAANDPNFGSNTNIVHTAYSNNTVGATQTTLYAIDSTTDSLVTIGSVNGTPSSPNSGQVFTVGELNADGNVGSFGGFDIEAGTNAAYAAFRISGVSYLYSINLTTGAATLIGEIAPDLGPNIDGIAIALPAASPTTDLAITKTNNATSTTAGTSTTYTIVATNNGATAVTGATVTDNLPSAVSSATWTCTGTNGGSCPGNGNGNIAAQVNLPVGASVTFTLIANISSSATGNLVNTVTIATPAGVTDSSAGNNSATDTDTITPAAPSSVTVSGQVLSSTGRYIPGVAVTITDPQGNSRSVYTGSAGYFQFFGVMSGQTYTISVASDRRYDFTPQQVQVNGNLNNVNFTGQEKVQN